MSTHQEDTQQQSHHAPKPGEKGSQGEFGLQFLFAMGELKGAVTALRDDFDGFKTDISKSITAIRRDTEEQIAAIDLRVKALERKSYWLAGASFIVGAIISIIVELYSNGKL